MNSEFEWGDDTIDSRDIIARYEELVNEKECLVEDLTDANEAFENIQDDHFDDEEIPFLDTIEAAKTALEQFDNSELELLESIVRQGETCSGWHHGITLIHDNYFTQYVREMVDEYEPPKDFDMNSWPWCHMEMNYEAAADSLRSDYTNIDAGGETYYVDG